MMVLRRVVFAQMGAAMENVLSAATTSLNLESNATALLITIRIAKHIKREMEMSYVLNASSISELALLQRALSSTSTNCSQVNLFFIYLIPIPGNFALNAQIC